VPRTAQRPLRLHPKCQSNESKTRLRPIQKTPSSLTTLPRCKCHPSPGQCPYLTVSVCSAGQQANPQHHTISDAKKILKAVSAICFSLLLQRTPFHPMQVIRDILKSQEPIVQSNPNVHPIKVITTLLLRLIGEGPVISIPKIAAHPKPILLLPGVPARELL